MEAIQKIYPTAEELSTINSCLPCTEEGCCSTFTSESNLNLHLEKTHKKEKKLSQGNNEYYCPTVDCIYNDEKYFKSLKLLKQHYLKVHTNKSFLCEGCSKGFPTQAQKNRHTEYCGVKFKCCDCDTSYSSYESLLTHGRRKQHKVLDKMAYNPAPIKVEKSNSGSDVRKIRKGAFVLPKASTSLQMVNVIPVVIVGQDKESQTEQTVLPKLKSKQTQVNKDRLSRKHTSQHSQTGALHKTSSSAETQTIGDYVCKKPKLALSDANLNKDDDEICLKSTKTQTKLVTSQSKSCNTSFELDEAEYVSIQRSTSSTQTALPSEALFSISTATHDSIHTDTSDLNFEFMHSSSQTCLNEDMSIFDSSNFFNCNTETQTDFMFDNDLLSYEDCCSNMQTQTINLKEENYSKSYDDILFNTIHTQTFFDDMARSVESQTTMTNKMQVMNCRDMANIETQTEIDFKQLLEEINA